MDLASCHFVAQRRAGVRIVSHNLIEADAVPAGQIRAFLAKRGHHDAEVFLNGLTVSFSRKGLTCRSSGRIVLASNVNSP